MDESIKNHECFKKLFEVVPGATRSIDIPWQFDHEHARIVTSYWAIHVFEKPKGPRTIALFINYCPMCGEKLTTETEENNVHTAECAS